MNSRLFPRALWALLLIFLINEAFVQMKSNANLESMEKMDASTTARTAYFTLVSSSEYEMGAQVLVCRLRRYDNHRKIYLFVDKGVRLKEKEFFDSMNVTIISNVPNPADEIPALKAEVRSKTYTKLSLWNYSDLAETAAYLDADTLPLSDPSGIFRQLPVNGKKAFAVQGSKKYFNSGVFVFRPSPSTYNQLVERLRTNEYDKKESPTEQDVLVSHFARENFQTRTRVMDQRFNVRPTKYSHKPPHFRDVVILHWIGQPKPWSAMMGKRTSVTGLGADKDTNPKWSMDIYQQAVQELQDICKAGKAGGRKAEADQNQMSVPMAVSKENRTFR